MSQPKPLKPSLAWAVVGKSGALCCSSYRGQKAVYTMREDAEYDCAPGQRVVRVRIVAVKRRGRK